MPGRVKSGYVAKAVATYLREHIDVRRAGGTGRGASHDAQFINGRRARADDLRRISAWANQYKLASLDAVDRLLIHYDLSIHEYETWAMGRYGNNTYFDTDEIIAELVAAA